MNVVSIVGIGIAPFVRKPGQPVDPMVTRAVGAALSDAGLAPGDVDLVVAAHSSLGRVAAQRKLRGTGISGIPMINVENACAGGGTAVHTAYLALRSGLYRTVLVVGMEEMERGLIEAKADDYEAAAGLTLPAKYAMRARRYVDAYGYRTDDLARVAVKNRAAGARNPNAGFQAVVTNDEVLASRPIADPLTLLQCCASATGAAALVLASGGVPGAHPEVVASVLRSGSPTTAAQVARGVTPEEGITGRAADAAYQMAGLRPTDIDMAEVHDAFTIGEVLAVEGLGLCEPGRGLSMVTAGETDPGGRLPVNASGGLLSRGHPLGASAVAQLVELTRALRHSQSGERKHIALAHSVGGSTPAIGSGACAVHILRLKESA